MNDGDLRRELKEQLANAASRRDEDAQQERVTQERQEQNDDASADVAEVDDDAEPVEAEEQSEPLEITQETPRDCCGRIRS